MRAEPSPCQPKEKEKLEAGCEHQGRREQQGIGMGQRMLQAAPQFLAELSGQDQRDEQQHCAAQLCGGYGSDECR
jgi:hypothetical protein